MSRAEYVKALAHVGKCPNAVRAISRTGSSATPVTARAIAMESQLSVQRQRRGGAKVRYVLKDKRRVQDLVAVMITGDRANREPIGRPLVYVHNREGRQ